MTTYNEAIAEANKAEYFLYTLEPCRVSWDWSVTSSKTDFSLKNERRAIADVLPLADGDIDDVRDRRMIAGLYPYPAVVFANVYEADCTREIGSVKEDGVALTAKTSTDDVEDNAGSWFWDRKESLLYAHATGSDNPADHVMCGWAKLYHRHGPKRGPYNERNYEPRSAEIHNFKRSLQNIFYGGAIAQFGTYEFTNADGEYDDLQDWIFNGQPISCKHGFDLIADADYETILNALMGTPGPEITKIKIPVGGLDKRLDRDMLTTQLGSGANVPDASVDKWIPRCFGTCYNVKPLFTNDATDEYQVNDGPVNDILAVRDDTGAIAYTKNAANGKFTLNAGPATGTVYADVEGDNTGASFRELGGEIMAWIAENIAGFAAGEIDSTAVTQFDAARPYELGIYVASQASVKSIFAKICESVFGCYYITRVGKLKPLAISVITGSADVTIYNHESDESGWQFLRQNLPPVAKSIAVYYRRDWSDSDQTRCKVTDATISLDAYPDAEAMEIQSYLLELADATAVGALYAAYLNQRRNLIKFTAYNKALRLELMDEVRIIKDRYAIDGYYKILGLEENLADGSVKITVIE